MIKSIPLAKDEVAEVEITFNRLVEIPPIKVEVPVVVTVKSLVIIVPVANIPPTVEVPLTKLLPCTANIVEVPAEVVPI